MAVLFYACYYHLEVLMKFIGVHSSLSGYCGSPPWWIRFSSQAMLLAIVRIVCIPSSSRSASPGFSP